MNRLFPSIPMVAEEDSSFLRSTNLVGAIVDVVANKTTFGDEVTEDSVLKAIDRGSKDAYNFGPNPATYWVLDPIDGTRGFVKGADALFVKISGYAPALDHAVGIICVHEAGGKVTDWEGSSIDFAADQVARRAIFPSGGFLVANHSLHNEILGLISSNSSIN